MSALEQCDMCYRELTHDYVHWNGAFYQCEECAVLEGLDPGIDGQLSHGDGRYAGAGWELP